MSDLAKITMRLRRVGRGLVRVMEGHGQQEVHEDLRTVTFNPPSWDYKEPV